MRVVLDTNVVVSGIFFSGPPLTILEAWRDGRIELVLCEEILAQYERVGEVLGRQYVGIDASPVFSLIAHHGSYVEIPEPPPRVCEDSDDDKFVACAIAGECQTLVSGGSVGVPPGAGCVARGQLAVRITSQLFALDGYCKREGMTNAPKRPTANRI